MSRAKMVVLRKISLFYNIFIFDEDVNDKLD